MIHKFRYWDSFNTVFSFSDQKIRLHINIFRKIAAFYNQLALLCDEGENSPIPEYYSQSNDINGREIYEGDIVRIATDEIGGTIPGGFTGEVRFMEGAFQVMNDELQLSFPVWQEIAQWEIIGNIHEGVKNEV